MGPCCRKTVIVISVLLATILTIGGVFLYFKMPKIIQQNIEQKLALNNGSESYKAWVKSPLPIKFQVNLFNVTNPADVLLGMKPIIKEMGPYGFWQSREKYDVEFDDDNDTVQFRQRRTFVFSPELSNGSLNDTITMPNVPLLALAKVAGTMSGYKKFMLNMMMQSYKAKPFVTKTVEEMIFKGYKDDFMAFIAKQEKRTILPNDTFGFFYGQNATSDGVYNIIRGNEDINSFSKIVTYNNMTSMPIWEGPYCSMLNGTDGSQYPPFVPQEGNLQMFVSDLCRSLYLTYNEEVMVEGIKLFRFRVSKELLQSGYNNQDNMCYCERQGNVTTCLPDGAMSISRCKKGAPLVVSLPHFYLADDYFRNAVEGLNPDPLLHDTNIDVEQLTGIVMNAAKRLQMNADMEPVPGITGYGKLPKVIFPLVWVYEGATINDASAEKFKSQLVRPLMLAKAITYALMGVGLIIFVSLFIYAVSSCCTKENDKNSLDLISANGNGHVTQSELKPMIQNTGTSNSHSIRT